tara:strand:- start:357 stop:563 length:207 start_codon:yes stop_codon:yes gene_type:complete
MTILRVENKKVEVGDLIRIKRTLFDLLENQIGVVTKVNEREVIINMIGHYRPVTIPDIRDWADIIEVL